MFNSTQKDTMTNEQYVRLNGKIQTLSKMAASSIMLDVHARRERVLKANASVRKFEQFLNSEIRRLKTLQ